ncbi:Remorin [Apostasia shenzhenica]|uniref:Remorin n=1 Tax=Apostasia shenzhenica TaxID=1088818 RepID=A0A2I0ACC7_9ASPA|nr:Remorin [Apostasia shenzhenica]
MRNKIASIHRAAEERRAMAEAKKGEELIKVQEAAAKFRAAGIVPSKFNCSAAFVPPPET